MRRAWIGRMFGHLSKGWCIALIVTTSQLSAEEIVVPVTISIDAEIDAELTPFVYIDGVLAGAIDGVVSIPEAASSTIEIGLPQARQPLYSLKLGPEQFEKLSAEVVMTSYSYRNTNADAFWANVNLDPNTIADVRLELVESGGYQLKLPASSYSGYEEIIKKFGVAKSSKDWVEAILDANDESKFGGITHLTGTNDVLWSGSYPASVRGSWPAPGYSERDWKITSEPAGAMIKTQVGDKGLTNRTVQLPDLSETFVVLRLAGYLDCPHNDAQCILEDKGGFIELQCKLKKK